MITSSLSSRRDLRIPGRSVATALVALALAAIAATWFSQVAATALVITLVVLAAACAWIWPGEMLAVAAIATLADPFIVQAVTAPNTAAALHYNTELILAVVGLPIVARAARDGSLVPALRHRMTPFLSFFVVVAAASALVNAVPATVAVAGVGVTLDGLAVFYLARMVRPNPRLMRRAIATFVGIMLLAALLAIGQVMLAPTLLGFDAFAGAFGEGARSTAFFGNPNQLAPLLGIAMPFPLLALADTRRRRTQIGLLAVSLLLAIAFWLTFSRAAWLAFVLAFIIVTGGFARRALLVGIAVGAVAFVLAIGMPRNLLASDSGTNPDVVDATFGRLGAIGAGSDLRVIFLREGLPIAAEHPALGVGPGRYGGAAANVFGTPIYAEYGIGLHGFHTVHNYWLHLLVEVGILGITAMIAAIAGVVWQLLQAARRTVGPRRILLLAAATIAIAVSLNSFAEMLLEGNTPSFMVWFLVGMASIVADRARTANPSVHRHPGGVREATPA